MSQLIAWDTILTKLNNHSLIDQSFPEDTSEPVHLPPYYQFPREQIPLVPQETRIVEKDLFAVNQNFMVGRTQNLKTLKIQSLQNINKTLLFQEHLYQISDVKFLENSSLIASCDISGLIFVWKVAQENNQITTKIIMKGKFEDKLGSALQIAWKNNQVVCTYNQNEISLWTFSEDNQSKGPIHFQTQVFENLKIKLVKLSQQYTILYVMSQSSIYILNSFFFQIIKEFKPYKHDKPTNLHIFKSVYSKNRDFLITESNKGVLKVWDLSTWQEDKKKFLVNQKISVQQQTMQYKKGNSQEISVWADIDFGQNVLFVMSNINNQLILQLFFIEQSYHRELQDPIDSSIIPKKLFTHQSRFQFANTQITQLKVCQIQIIQQDYYFQYEGQMRNLELGERQDMAQMVFIVYTVGANNINVSFIQGDSFGEHLTTQGLKILQEQDQQKETHKSKKDIVQEKDTVQENEKKQKTQVKSSEKVNKNIKTKKNTQNLSSQNRERSKSYYKKEENVEVKTEINKELNVEKKENQIDNQSQQKKPLIAVQQIQNQNVENHLNQQQIEEKISQKLDQIFKDQNYTSQIEDQIKQQIEKTMKKEFQSNFQLQITPIFEKYLENIFLQVMNTFEQGQQFYNDKLDYEKQKVQKQEEQMNESLKFLNKQSLLFQQFTENSMTSIQQLENKMKDKEYHIQQLIEQMQGLQKSNIDQNLKLQEIEKQLSRSILRAEEVDQTNSHINSNSEKRGHPISSHQQHPSDPPSHHLPPYYPHPLDRSYPKKPEDSPLGHLLSALENFQRHSYHSYHHPYNYHYPQPFDRQNLSYYERNPQEFKREFQFEPKN